MKEDKIPRWLIVIYSIFLIMWNIIIFSLFFYVYLKGLPNSQEFPFIPMALIGTIIFDMIVIFLLTLGLEKEQEE